MNTAVVKKPNLWLEGLGTFQRHIREWLPIAGGFFVILAIINCAFFGSDAQAMLEKFKDFKTLTTLSPEDKAAMMHLGTKMCFMGLCMIVVSAIQGYVFLFFYLEREPSPGKPVLGVGRFFYLVWNVFLVVLIMFGLGIPLGFLSGVAGALHAGWLTIVFAIFVWIPLVLFVMVRICLVSPLAVCRVSPVVRTSWRMTKGNFWRLFGNGIMIVIVILGVMLAFVVVEGVFGALLAFTAPSALAYVKAIFSAAQSCLVGGISMAYACTKLRYLSEEQNVPVSRPTTKTI